MQSTVRPFKSLSPAAGGPLVNSILSQVKISLDSPNPLKYRSFSPVRSLVSPDFFVQLDPSDPLVQSSSDSSVQSGSVLIPRTVLCFCKPSEMSHEETNNMLN